MLELILCGCVQDVLAGRKTGGKITGDIMVNGYPQNLKTFNRIMG